MKARIKIGAKIGQDHSFFTWPRVMTKSNLKSSYNLETKNSNMIFEVENSGGIFKCRAPGYGQEGNYGNGIIFVFQKDDLEFLD